MIALVLSLLVSPVHAGKKRPTPDVVEDALAYATTDRTKAVTLLEAALESGPNARDLPVIALHAGEQRRLDGDGPAARAWFEKALQASGGDDDAARLGIVLLDSLSGLPASAVADLKRIGEKSALDTQNADRFLLLAVDAVRSENPGKVSQYAKKALSYAESDPEVQARIGASLERLASGDVEAATESGGTTMERARAALEKGDRARAAQLATKALAEAPPDSFEALQAQYLVKRAEAGAPVDPDRIAVLLPLSGKYEAVGRQVTEAIEYGFRAGGGTKKLDFVDTGATPEGAVAALEDAVLRDGAVAVMGPLLSDSTEAVVEAAAALEVPLVSISQANESDEHPWIFQGVPSIGDQVAALLDHVMGQEGRTAFAIFSPDTAYGKRAAEQFRTQVEARGGSITVETTYDPKASALMEFAAQLGRKDYEARKTEMWRLRKAAEEAGRDPSGVVLPPTIDFQGLFIPDNHRKIPIAAAALAYEEFPIGEFRPRAGDELVPLLGLAGWNNEALFAAGGEYVRDSRFLDAFYVPDNKAFAEAYKVELGRTPTSLEATTVDAAHLLAAASKAAGQTRDAFREALDGVSASGLPTGATGFDDARRRVESTMEILTIDREGIRPIGTPRD